MAGRGGSGRSGPSSAVVGHEEDAAPRVLLQRRHLLEEVGYLCGLLCDDGFVIRRRIEGPHEKILENALLRFLLVAAHLLDALLYYQRYAQGNGIVFVPTRHRCLRWE